MGLKNRNFTDEQFIEVVKSCESKAGILKKLSLKSTGANGRMVRILIKRLNIDTSHFTGQGHLKGRKCKWSKKTKLSEILVENSTYQSHKLKLRLIAEGLMSNSCSKCKISEWQGEKLSLQLHHINGIRTDNRIENLQILCPNCHSLTDNYCGKGTKGQKASPNWVNPLKKKKNTCLDCGKELYRDSKRCRPCSAKARQNTRLKIQWPSTEDLIKMTSNSSFAEVGKQLGVSKSAVRKRIKRHPVKT